jgi:hypothetical protein
MTELDFARLLSAADRVAAAPVYHVGRDVAVRCDAADWSEFRLRLSRAALWQAERLNLSLDTAFDEAMAVSR